MRVVLLAAGLGTRLRPITEITPKCLVNIRGKPLLQYWFDLLFTKVERILINTHYLPDLVKNYVNASNMREHVDLVYEEVLLGTGGTILENKAWFGQSPFMVAHADNLTLFDISDFIKCHQLRPVGCEITMMTFDTDDPTSCGIVEERNGIVISFYEKIKNPVGIRANAAVYIFEPSVIQFMMQLNKKVIDLSTDVIPNFMGRICTFHNDNYHRDIGNIKSLNLADKELKSLFPCF